MGITSGKTLLTVLAAFSLYVASLLIPPSQMKYDDSDQLAHSEYVERNRSRFEEHREQKKRLLDQFHAIFVDTDFSIHEGPDGKDRTTTYSIFEFTLPTGIEWYDYSHKRGNAKLFYRMTSNDDWITLYPKDNRSTLQCDAYTKLDLQFMIELELHDKTLLKSKPVGYERL